MTTPNTSVAALGLSQQFWDKLSPESQDLYLRVRPRPRATRGSDTSFDWIERVLASTRADCEAAGGSVELDPDFQRGHVWTGDQRSAYIEAVLRHQAPITLSFNCPGWSGDVDADGDIPEMTHQCIDGLQRLTAVRMFMAGEVKVFGGRDVRDLAGTPFSANRYFLRFDIFEFTRRSDLLSYYLDLNSGGTVHAASELARVRKLLEEACTAQNTEDVTPRPRG